MADFAPAKACVLDNMRAVTCTDIADIEANLNTWDDVFGYLVGCIGMFECDPDYLYRLLSCGDIDELNARGIYFNQELADAIVNPQFVAFCKVDEVVFNDGLDHEDVVIFKTDLVKLDINMEGIGTPTHIHVLHISGGSQIKLITNSDTTSLSIDYLRVAGCKSFISRVFNSMEVVINQINTINGGFYGGSTCIDTTTTPCTDEVKILAAQNITTSSIDLKWEIPDGSIGLELRYRKINEPDWTEVNSDILGHYTPDGFTFINLDKDTYYDFHVVNICTGGFKSTGALIRDKTHR
jgi:hypothetical protein